ncbi:MAG: O-antigen ligase family protein, partial [Candidatus Omnitrophica bacterium]|nr:O-antigen ligase family protein [Candidatus Omnitrophota bacterium]
LRNRYLEQLLIVLLTFLFIIILFFLTDFKVIIGRFISIMDKPNQIFDRGYLWSDMVKIWLDHVFWGTGLGTFSKIAPLYKSSNLQMIVVHAHNDYLQLLVETGIFGVLFVILFFYFYFSSLFKMWFRRNDRFVTSLVLGGTISMFSIFLHSLVDFNLRIPANALLFFIIMGLNYKLVFTGFKKRDALSFEDIREGS